MFSRGLSVKLVNVTTLDEYIIDSFYITFFSVNFISYVNVACYDFIWLTLNFVSARFYFVGDEDLLEIIGNSKNIGRKGPTFYCIDVCTFVLMIIYIFTKLFTPPIIATSC